MERREDAIYSKFCRKCYTVPNIEKDTSILRKFFVDLKKLKDGGVLFPTSDLYSLHLSELKDDLEDHYHPLVPKIAVTKTLVEKKRFYQSLSEQKVPHPATLFPTSIENVERVCGELEYPVFVKPSMSQGFWEQFGKKGFTANSAEDLLKYLSLMSRHKFEAVVQEIIPGPDSNMYGIGGYFDEHHRPEALFAYHRLRGWPPVFGTSSLIESFSISSLAPMRDIITGYLHRLGYYGIMEAEFKRDPRDGVLKLIEINARTWWQNSLPTICGINIVLIAYLAAIGKKTKHSGNYEEGIKWINFLNDLASAIETRTSAKDWVRSLKNTKEWSYFAGDDFVPWIVSNCETAKGILKRTQRLLA